MQEKQNGKSKKENFYAKPQKPARKDREGADVKAIII